MNFLDLRCLELPGRLRRCSTCITALLSEVSIVVRELGFKNIFLLELTVVNLAFETFFLVTLQELTENGLMTTGRVRGLSITKKSEQRVENSLPISPFRMKSPLMVSELLLLRVTAPTCVTFV